MSENGLTWEVLEQIPVAIAAVREDGEITFVNLRAEALFGYSRAELLGDSIHRLVPDRFAGQHADFLRGFLAAPRARPMGAGRVLFARRKDGSEFPAEIALNPLQTAGGAITLSFIRDLTLRLRAEAQMRLQATALESSADGIVITDRGGRITWANPAFSQLTGYSLEEVLGQNPRLLKSGAHDESFYASMWAEILAGRVWRGETVNRHKDGRLYVEEQTITPVRGEHHEITHFIAIKHDITARKQAETALERERAYLEALHDVSLGLLARRDLNELLEDLVKRAGELVGSDSGFLDLVDAETGQLRPTVGTGALRESLRHPVARGEGLAGRVWETGKPLIVDDYDT